MSPKSKAPVPAFFDVKHEYEASFKAYQDAVNILTSTVSTILSIAKTPEAAFKLLPKLKEANDAYRKAAFGDDS